MGMPSLSNSRLAIIFASHKNKRKNKLTNKQTRKTNKTEQTTPPTKTTTTREEHRRRTKGTQKTMRGKKAHEHEEKQK